MGEFRAFIARGNVIDLAVAVIIGAAFAVIVASLTGDLIMPLVGALFGDIDLSNYFVLLGPVPEGYSGPMSYEALKEAGVPMLGWGRFLTVLVNFLILAFIIFQLVRMAARAAPKEEEAAAAPSEEALLLREIRDALTRKP